MVIDLKKTTIKLIDGTATPLDIEIKIGEGNLVYTEKRNMDYIRDKGALDTVREGDEEPVEVRFEFTWDYITGSTTTGVVPSIEDALKGIGAAQDWVSSDTGDACAPFAVDIEVEHDPTTGAAAGCSGDTETTTLSDFRFESLEHDIRGGQVSCSGNCNTTTATHVRAAS